MPSSPVPAATLSESKEQEGGADDTRMGETAAMLVEALLGSDSKRVFFAAGDEPRARSIAAILKGMCGDKALVLFVPSSDALPGDDAPASPANVGQRVSSLRVLHGALAAKSVQPIILVTTGEALGRQYAAPDAYAARPPAVSVGETVELAALAQELEAIGYIADERVDEPGEIALRGQVLDVFPADAPRPVRIEEADGKIVAIHVYDAGDQRSVEDCEDYEIGRAAEPRIRTNPSCLLDHLPDATTIITPAAEDRRRRFLALAKDAASRQPGEPDPQITAEADWRQAMKDRQTLDLQPSGKAPPRFVEAKSPEKAFARYARKAIAADRKIVMCGSARDLRFLSKRAAKLLEQEAAPVADWFALQKAAKGSISTLEVPIDRGFIRDDLAVIAAADLLGSRAGRSGDDAQMSAAEQFGFGEIRVGDVVVHEDHGIAVVAGLAPMPVTTLEQNGDGAGSADGDPTREAGDAIVLTYAEENTRLVPVAEADLLWRYGAEQDAVSLDRLDGSSWQKRRAKIDKAIAESAAELIALAAERSDSTAPVFDPEVDAYERFVAGFPFTETPDQARAIDIMREDLASGAPMRRLVVGDVGYGKTEVALRAAAIAALSGWQVALAAPTTVLARQHLQTFGERFAGTGIEVAGLSRVNSSAERKRVKDGLADGSIRIAIGTAAVAGKGVEYKNLGLVIIDEEQRFGTADKNRLQELSAGHSLSLSATPIPRTLQGALVGLQQLSVIATPPARRQPIRTDLGTWDPDRIRAALLREKSRGGQSFIVVPRIADIEPLAEKLAKLVPELELLRAHGDMPADEIDEAMVDFGAGRGDILLATNIIEAGLDVPRANTMIIHRADRFGLSQLHQLRGRVGRASRRGHVLLLTEGEDQIAPRTLKRLRTLEAFDRLGAGFQISARDLDMRGAGDLLGDAQAGHMKLIGVELYQFLLESALRAERGEDVERWTPELNLGVEGHLPEDWIPDEELRVTLYARLARIPDSTALDAFAEELVDRFGAIPDAAERLLAIARIRATARRAAIARIDAGPGAIALTPRDGFAADISEAGLETRDDRLILKERIADPGERLARVVSLVDMLADSMDDEED